MEVNGVVTAIYDKKFDDGGEARSIKIEGNPLYYRLGKKKYPGIVEKGNQVRFFAEQTDDKAAKVTSEVTLAKKAVAVETTAAAVQGTAPAQSKGAVDWDAKDAKIQYQSSRKDALVFVDFLLRNSAVVIPAKQTSRVAFLEALLDKYTASFVLDVATSGAVARAVPPTVEKPTPKAEAVDEGDEEG